MKASYVRYLKLDVSLFDQFVAQSKLKTLILEHNFKCDEEILPIMLLRAVKEGKL